MIQSFTYLMLLVMTFLFSQMKHPLSMGFLLLIQTLIVCIITGIMHNSFWFSYILFLVFLGGMLVLFIYVTSLASNEMFNFSMKLLIICMIFMFSILLINFFMDKTYLIFNNNIEMTNLDYNNTWKENYNIINKLYNYPTNFITLLLINYLFFTLIVIVKVTNFFYGPLRNLN